MASPLASEAGLGGIDLPALRAYASSFGQVDALLPAALMAQLQHVHTLLRSHRAWAWQMGVMHSRGGARRGEVPPVSLKTDGERGARGRAHIARHLPPPRSDCMRMWIACGCGSHSDDARRPHSHSRQVPLVTSPLESVRLCIKHARPRAVLHGPYDAFSSDQSHASGQGPCLQITPPSDPWHEAITTIL